MFGVIEQMKKKCALSEAETERKELLFQRQMKAIYPYILKNPELQDLRSDIQEWNKYCMEKCYNIHMLSLPTETGDLTIDNLTGDK